uniref:Uncharacterized protein n=1 Tax=Arundo donax TaxID=35708 RepID=A0A0A8Z766_ARUDO
MLLHLSTCHHSHLIVHVIHHLLLCLLWRHHLCFLYFCFCFCLLTLHLCFICFTVSIIVVVTTLFLLETRLLGFY